MHEQERESTRDWLLPEGGRPPLIGELEARIDEALATARASEAAVMTVGAAALDAAEQARRAADLAERASGAMLSGRPVLGAVPPPGDAAALPSERPEEDDGLRNFSARADRIAARLRELERVSIPAIA